ncbi:hypothetical protein NM208_g299 [Fusarium decemcellulare]|uniref:Uncharacterized protein n=1 Tax=Fusarium decemcellulare TaxID=57161 RepID=A0ACC1T0A0_9HYPO|nr:hypothetical protein NM208_g299 [Fusarium decemcellulare]
MPDSLVNASATPTESVLVVRAQADAIESALTDDSRTKVLPRDIQPGGKYYSIVKLQGTGWLITPSLLVTAGHCAFDHTHNLGKAVKVRAYVGYRGKDSLNDKGVQFRTGVKIATPKEWITSDINRASDVAFVEVNRPFDNIDPILYEPTPPLIEKIKLSVVGYPSDRTFRDEPAAEMYEMHKDTTCDLSKTTLNTLEYTISSYGGQSGSPVLKYGENTSIGAHVYGLGNKNSASVIRGPYGNYFKEIINSMHSSNPISTTSNGIDYFKIEGRPEGLTKEVVFTEESAFWGTFTKVVNVGAKIGGAALQVGTPFLGPIGAPIAAVAGTALSVVSKLTDQGAESSFETENPQTDYKQYATRAIVSEAALQAVLKMNMEQANKYGVFTKMQEHYSQAKDLVPKVAKIITPAIAEPALPPATESSFDSVKQPFIDGILRQAKVMSSESTAEQESFFDFVSSVVQTAASVASPVMGAVSAIANAIGSAENSMELDPSDISPLVEVLCHRALLGEAALQALMSSPAHDIQDESWFSDLVNTVKDVGPAVIKVAPTVIRTVTPLVSALVGSGESQLSGGGSENRGRTGTAGTAAVPKPSGMNGGSKSIASQSSADLVRGNSPALHQSNGIAKLGPSDSSLSGSEEARQCGADSMPYLHPQEDDVALLDTVISFQKLNAPSAENSASDDVEYTIEDGVDPSEYAISTRAVDDGAELLVLMDNRIALTSTQPDQLSHCFSAAIASIVKQNNTGSRLIKDVDLLDDLTWNRSGTILSHLAPAVFSWDGEMSCAKLDVVSTRLAWHLVNLGVKSGQTMIPICFDESIWVTVSILAIFKTGAAFVPIDLTQTIERLRKLLEEVDGRLFLTSRPYSETSFDEGTTVVAVNQGLIDSLAETVPEGQELENKHHVMCSPPQNLLAYLRVFYPPRGSDHKLLLFWYRVGLLKDLARVPGDCICIPSNDDRMGDISKAINTLQASLTFLTTTVANLKDPKEIPSLHTNTLGEEATTYTVYCIVNCDDPERLLPIGAVEKLLVKKHILALGYLNDAERTTRTFIESPQWMQRTGQSGRLSRTGDLVRYSKNDGLVYIEGADTHVKVRGQRVELKEVEIQLSTTLPHIRQIITEVIVPSGNKSTAMVATFVVAPRSAEMAYRGGGSFQQPLPKFNLFVKHMLEMNKNKAATDIWKAQLSGYDSQAFPPLPSVGHTVIADNMIERACPSLPRNTQGDITVATVIQASLALTIHLKTGTNDVVFGIFSRHFSHDSLGDSQASTSRHIFESNSDFGGEPAFPSDFEPWIGSVDNIFNVYGPSECTAICCASRIEMPCPVKKLVSGDLGMPLGSHGWIVDPDNMDRLMPFGAVGELIIEGPIIPLRLNPEGEEQWTRAAIWKYKQTKLRGQRLELGEVEFHLHVCMPHVDQLAVEVIPATDTSSPALAAFIVNVNDSRDAATDNYFGTIRRILDASEAHCAKSQTGTVALQAAVSDVLFDLNPIQKPFFEFQQDPNVEFDQCFLLKLATTGSYQKLSDALGYDKPELRTQHRSDINYIWSLQRYVQNKADLATYLKSAALLCTELNDRPLPTIWNEGHGREVWDDSLDISRTRGWFTTMAPVVVSGSEQKTLQDYAREVQDSMRSMPQNGRSQFVSRFVNKNDSDKFISNLPTDIMFNYSSGYGQLERQNSLFQNITAPNSRLEHTALVSNFRHYAIFDVLPVVNRGRLSYQTSLEALGPELINESNNDEMLTMSDFLGVVDSYEDIEEFHEDIIPTLDISSVNKIEHIYSTTPMQEGILVSQIKDNKTYHSRLQMRVTSIKSGFVSRLIDLIRLQKAWLTVVQRHDLLRVILVHDFPGNSATNQGILLNPRPSIQVLHNSNKSIATQSLVSRDPSHYTSSSLQHHFSIHYL